MDDWTPENLLDLIQEQLHKGNITEDDVLAALSDYRPLKIVSRGDIAKMVQSKLQPSYNPTKGENPLPNPLAKLADITDAVMAEIEGNVGLDDLTWAGIEATIDAIIMEEL